VYRARERRCLYFRPRFHETSEETRRKREAEQVEESREIAANETWETRDRKWSNFVKWSRSREEKPAKASVEVLYETSLESFLRLNDWYRGLSRVWIT